MAWKDAVEGHPLWRSLTGAREVLNDGEWPDDADLRDALARARQVLDQVEQRNDPSSLTTESLNNANSAVTNLANSLANARGNPAGYVAQVHQYLDQLLTFIGAWPAPDRLRLTQGIREASDNVRATAEKVIADLKDQLQAERSQAVQNLAEWQEQANEQLAALAAKNEDLASKLAEATNELAAQRQRLDTALNDNATTFQAGEKERTQAARAANKQAQDEKAQLFAGIKSEGEARLAEMDDMREQARTTLETIGVSATAGHYETYATEQKEIADNWRLGAVIALCISGLVFIAAFVGSLFAKLTWHDTVLELALGGAVAGVSGYAGGQSAGHRKQERKAQRFALGLKAMTSYLATADAEKVDDLKVRLASQLFIDDGEADPATNALPPLAAAVAPLVESAVKAAVQKNT